MFLFKFFDAETNVHANTEHSFVHELMHAPMRMHIYIYIYVYVYVYIYVLNIRVYIYICMHAHSRMRELRCASHNTVSFF